MAALVVVSYVHFLQAVGHSGTGTHVHGKLSERNSASRTEHLYLTVTNTEHVAII